MLTDQLSANTYDSEVELMDLLEKFKDPLDEIKEVAPWYEDNEDAFD